MKRYMLEIRLNGKWTPVYLCATKAEALVKVQRWEGPARIKEVRK